MTPPVPWYLNPVLLTPAFGLLGVLVGGLITFGTSFFLDEKREERQRRREETQQAKELRRAVRLVGDDLITARYMADSSVERKKWYPKPHTLMSFENWIQHRHILADLPSDAWIHLATAIQILRAAENNRILLLEANRFDLNEDMITTLKTAINQIEETTQKLRPDA